MSLSRTTTAVLIDMIENRLAMMQISDREELREVMILQKCLAEIQGLASSSDGPSDEAIPRRGRRRKLADMMETFAVSPCARKQA